MNREILFRGKVVRHPDWTEMNGKWAVGFFVNALEEYPDVPGARIPEIVSLKAENRCTGEYSFYETFEVDPETVGQYTGLVDKNGKKIFEGDVLKLDEYVKNMFSVDDGFVDYFGGMFRINNENNASLRYSLNTLIDVNCVLRGEVIGNIWDNPELLEKKE